MVGIIEKMHPQLIFSLDKLRALSKKYSMIVDGSEIKDHFFREFLDKFYPQLCILDDFLTPAVEIENAPERALLTFMPNGEQHHLAQQYGISNIFTFPLPIGDPFSFYNILEALDLNRVTSFAMENIEIEELIKLFDFIAPASKAPPNGIGRNWDRYFTTGSLEDREKQIITEIATVLGDPQSKAAYYEQFYTKPQEIWRKWWGQIPNSRQYFDYINLTKQSVVLNLGLHSGAEVPGFLAILAEEGRLINFDPLGEDYLHPYVKDWYKKKNGPQLEVHRTAISNYKGELPLCIDSDFQARQRNDPEEVMTSFPCDTIDNIVEDLEISRLDLIKFDIESGEEQALDAIEKTIINYRPQIALSVYHKREHYWKLPQRLIPMCENYNFYYRYYSFEARESVFYAIPKECT